MPAAAQPPEESGWPALERRSLSTHPGGRAAALGWQSRGIDQYLNLNSQEQREFDRSVKALVTEEAEEVMEIVTSWMKEGLRQGRQEGRQEGRLEAARDAVIEILEARFKKIPLGLKRGIKRLDDASQLKLLLRHAATAPALKDFQQRLAQRS